MTLENKLHLENSVDLARKEGRIGKKRAVELFESGESDQMKAGSFESLKGN